jgi:hypothetical protein
MDINFLAQHNKSILITDAYTPSKEWHLLEYPGRKDNETRHGADFPHLIFSLRILRRPLTYTYLLIIPCVLLSVLNLVIFWLPPEAPAKMMLGNLNCLYGNCFPWLEPLSLLLYIFIYNCISQ